MMRQILLAILFFFSSNFLFSQVKVDTLRFYFPINVFSADAHASRIDSFVKSSFGRIIKVKILGYADFLHDPVYNQELSQKRADAIKDLFLKKIPPVQINSISAKGLGERFSKDNGSKEGEAFSRRVDLVVEPFIIKQEDNAPVVDTVKHLDDHAEKIEKLKVGESLAVEGLNFEPGRHYIVKASVPILNNLLKIMKDNPNLKIEIQGHICCLDGTADGRDMETGFNNLSVTRAKAVHDFLIKNGIAQDRLSYKGFGHSKPKFFPELTEADEQANRRVEIMVIEK
jgi:outer membrane protein OmpA-like peptidoglycan-associated protein